MFKYLLLLCSLAACGTDDLSDPQLATHTAAIGDKGDTISDFGGGWEVLRVHNARLERRSDDTWAPVGEGFEVETSEDAVEVEVEAPAGGGVRVRVFDGSFSPWSAEGVSLSLPARVDTRHDLTIETRLAGTTIATHGYIKIKKLNSGG